MRKVIEHEKDQRILFANHYIGDRLSEDHEVYQFDKLISSLDLSSITNNYNSRGGAMYSPLNMLSVIVYGYFQGVTSSRKLQELIEAHLAYIYLSGGNQIKYRSICSFRKKHLSVLKSLFVDSVKLASDSGLVKRSDVFALDGSKIEADASVSRTRKKQDWERKESEILAEVEKFLDKWAKTDEEEDALEEVEKERMKKTSKYLDEVLERKKQRFKPRDNNKNQEEADKTDSSNHGEDSSDKKQNSKKVKISSISDCESALKRCEQIDNALKRNPNAPDSTFLNLTDPDCRVMKSDSTTKECFNSQIITNNQIIVAADVTNHENDQNELETMLEQLKKNLALVFGTCEGDDDTNDSSTANNSIQLTADAGYNQGKNLAYLDKQKDIDAFVSMNNRNYRRFRLRGLDYVRGEFMIVALAHNLGKILRHQQKKGQNEPILSDKNLKVA